MSKEEKYSPEQYEDELVRLLGNAKILGEKDTPHADIEYEETISEAYDLIEEEFSDFHAEQAIEMLDSGNLEGAYQLLDL